jgi:hypothetical protein
MPNQMVEAAIDYTLRGWSVIPINPSTRRPNIQGWTDMPIPSRGQIYKWWRQYPSAGIGIVTGKVSGIFAVDIDYKNGKDGFKALESGLENEPSLDPVSDLIASTPTGGSHVYFALKDDMDVRNAVGIMDGVDIRGEGGFVIAPPTWRYVDGQRKTYSWLSDPKVQPSDPPEWVEELLAKGKSSKSASSSFDLSKVVGGLDEGERDLHLYRFAWSLRGRQVPYDLATAFVRTAAGKCKPPFDEAIAAEKVDRVYAMQEGINHDR